MTTPAMAPGVAAVRHGGEIARLGRELDAVRADVERLVVRVRRLERRAIGTATLDHAIAFTAGALLGALAMGALVLTGSM